MPFHIDTAGHTKAFDYPDTAGHTKAFDYPDTAGHTKAFDYPDTAGHTKAFDYPDTAGHTKAFDYPDTAGHTKAFDYPLMDLWGKVKVVSFQVRSGREPTTCRFTVQHTVVPPTLYWNFDGYKPPMVPDIDL